MRERKLKEATYDNQTLSYFLIIEQEFGIKIECSSGEKEIIRNVFQNKKEAQNFIEILCDGLVTPTTLLDVVTDYIDERDFISWHMR